MKFIGLISGGKDGFYSVQKCIQMGHTLVGLVYINSENGVLDSYMYQTVGWEIISAYQYCVNVPLFIKNSKMNSRVISLEYHPTEEDEVEDLYQILSEVKNKIDFDAITSGAIASEYQKRRVENVADRIGIVALNPLWNKPQFELLNEMIADGMVVRVAKVANVCLDSSHVGIYLNDLLSLVKDFKDINFCGEGGEYETICEYAPFFTKKVVITQFEIICDTIVEKPSSAYYMKINSWKFVEK